VIAGFAWLAGTAVLCAVEAGGLPGPLPAHPVRILFGICCLTVLGGFWSLAARISTGAVAGGLLVVAVSAAFVLRGTRPSRSPAPALGAAGWLLGLVVVIAAAQTASPLSSYDTGLYHIQAIRWIEQYPAVPGLANLHDRLAFSGPWFVAQALFDPVLFGGRCAFGLNGLIFVVAVAYCLGGLDGGFADLTLSRLLRLGCVPLAFWLLRRSLSSASPDAPLALLSWVVLLLLAEKLETDDGAGLDATAFVITGLAMFAAVTKLSAAPLLLAPAWLIRRKARIERRGAAMCAGLALTAALPFAIRNVILSGYLSFPVPWTGIPGLSWTVPREKVAAHLARIGDWARLPNGSAVPALDLAAWLPGWWGRLTPIERGLLAALPLLALVHAALALRRRHPSEWPPGSRLLAGLTLAGTVLWLITAPDPRFGWSFFPFLTLLLASLLLTSHPVRDAIRRLPRPAVVLVLAVLLLDQGRRVIAQHGTELADAWLWPSPPSAVETRSVRAGAPIHVPVQGEQCWDAPLPCAPELDPRLALRGSGLEEGFVIQSR
jgi:hypothetical protein